jgi:hypothetical protein
MINVRKVLRLKETRKSRLFKTVSPKVLEHVLRRKASIKNPPFKGLFPKASKR